MGIPVGVPVRRSFAKSSASRARSRTLRSLRGYTRTSGYYGRFAGTGTELKFFDTSKALTTVAATGTILDDSLNHIAQGTGESDRIGRKCTLKSINLHGLLQLPAATAAVNTDDVVRFIVFLDKQCNGAAAGVTDILETNDFFSFNNLANKSRFRILCDKKLTINAQGATATAGAYTYGEQRKGFNLYLRCNLPLEFDNTTGAITELRSNNIGVLAISNQGTARIQYTSRVRYADN